MNSSIVLMLLIMVGIGYVAHPIVWPHIDDGQPEKTKVDTEVTANAKNPSPEASKEQAVTVEEEEVVEEELIEPVVAEIDSPRIIEEATEPMDEESVEEEVAVEVVEDEIPEVDALVEVDEATLVAAMKQSVQAGEVTSFTYADVTDWSAGDDEVFEGKLYKCGVAKVKMTSILGVNEHGVKALYADGKIAHWVQAVSRVKIK